MTVPDPTAPTAEDVIAEAVAGAQGVPFVGRNQRRITAAVVAAIRAMSVETLAELIDGTVQQVNPLVATVERRVVGPWQVTP